MRHRQTIDENQKTLRRIVAVLLGLAGLLERAAGRSGAVCFLVLWLLRPGEAVAWAYLDALAPGTARLPAPEPLRPDPARSATRAEALRLARSFRAVAAALAAYADDGLASWQAAPRLAVDPAALAGLAARGIRVADIGRLDSS